MFHITVREYARLVVAEHPAPQNTQLDKAEISQTAFDYLYQLNQSLAENGQQFLSLGNSARELRLNSFVGVLETPCGTEIEILPKHENEFAQAQAARNILINMLSAVLDLPKRDSGIASIEQFKVPLTEWFFAQFLAALKKLYQTGIRFDYQRVEEEQGFLRGQLNHAKQIRKPVTKQHLFSIRYDIFTANRAENRLIRSCVDIICRRSQNNQIKRAAHKFHLLFAEVPISKSCIQDFKQWKTDRLMSHYADIKYWCELILGHQLPFAVKGTKRGKSILFPMEKLFERYVQVQLANQLCSSTQLEAQKSNQYLASYSLDQQSKQKKMFNLRPDLAIQYPCDVTGVQKFLILDTKWKLLDSSSQKNFGLQQSDMYQMFAYNHVYQRHQSDIILIYPQHAQFMQPLAPIHFNLNIPITGLQAKVWVLPFNLKTGRLELNGAEIEGLKFKEDCISYRLTYL